MTSPRRPATWVLLTATSVCLLALIAPTPARAAATPASANDIVATDVSVAEAPVAVAARVPTAAANRPRTITVTNHGGRSVTLFAKGERIRRVLAPGARPAVFTGLTPGRTYTVAIGGEPIGAVVALVAPTGASGLTVRTTEHAGSVALSWRHRTSTARGGRGVVYDVVATSRTAPRVAVQVRGTRSATLSGLDPDALYSFRVTPRNAAGTGRATSARMSRTLGQLGQGSPAEAPAEAAAPVAVPTAVPVEQPPVAVAPPAPAPAPAPAPGPAPAPRPSTKTIWVCPDSFEELAGQCIKTMAYTYHEEVETSPYTYHSEQQVDTKSVAATFDGSVWTWTCPSGYSAGGGQWGVGICKGTVTVSVKDPAPLGWYDTGSAYGHDVDVRDPLPEGYLDDGTQWVMTAAKVSREVAA